MLRPRFSDTEVIFVSDGSTDRTDEFLADIVQKDCRCRALILTRNFGHQAAVTTGLRKITADIVAVIDGDLQDPPEVIEQLVNAIDAGADVAYGVRRKRKENLLKRISYFAFYRLLKSVASIDIPLDAGDFCAMRRSIVDALNDLPERNRFVRGLRAWVGGRQVGVEYERAERFSGMPKYTMSKLFALTYDGLFSFSSVPVRFAQILGACVSLGALVATIGYITWYFLQPERFPQGFATLVISIWFLGGVQLLFMGIVGEYVFRSCDESRRRPVALIGKELTSISTKSEPVTYGS